MTERMCPRCGAGERQVKAGMNSGRQQYRCGACGRRYIPERKEHGYPSSLRQRAAALRAAGQTLVQIATNLGVTTRTLSTWFRSGALQGERSEAATAESGVPAPSSSTAPDSANDRTRAAGEAAPLPFPAERRRVTIHDVARHAGVAPSTVSNYLNDKGRMNSTTRERIRKAIDKLQFTRNALTLAIRNRRTRIIGVVVYGTWDFVLAPTYSIVPSLLAGVNRSAESLGHDVLIYTSWHNPEPHGSIRFLDGHIDGLVVAGSTLPAVVLERTAATGLPIMAMLTRDVPANVGYITVDNVAAMHAIVEHLISTGRRRIGYFGPLHDSDHIDRYRGFGKAMTAAGLSWDPSPTEATIRSAASSNDAAYLLRPVIDMAETLDAIVLPTDWWAARAVEQLAERGLRVPDDIAVTGFDDVLEARYIAGGLTTMRQPFHTIGQLAVERLLAIIEGAPVTDCRLIVPAELVVRASTS